MNILVINGSPKGDYSITLQSLLYLKKKYPKYNYEFLNVGQKYRLFEKDMSEPIQKIESAELIIFSYPVYTFLVPFQLHRFIELLKENGVMLTGKFVTQITTSKHFYDVTAHRFIKDNVQDLGAKFINGLSADMDDLLKEQGRKDLRAFLGLCIYSIRNNIFEPIPIVDKTPARHIQVTQYISSGPKKRTLDMYNVTIVADLRPEDHNLSDMIERFKAKITDSTLNVAVKVINLHEFNFKGGCLGCFNCATGGECIYTDGFSDLLRNEIQTGDAIVLAFSIKDHSMGSTFKCYDDRQFVNGHRTVTMGKPFGYIISGDYSKEANLKTVIEARAEVGGNFLAGVATDEYDPDRETDTLSTRLLFAMKHKYVQPSNFYGVGGMKIFRDLIYLMQGMMREDHKFFKEHGQYDFPQKNKLTLAKMYLVGGLISNPKIKQKLGNNLNEGMLMPYRKYTNPDDDEE